MRGSKEPMKERLERAIRQAEPETIGVDNEYFEAFM